jgi:hypothetical protein
LTSKHRQPAATPTAREGGIDPRDLGLRQLYIGRAGILFDMLDAGRFGIAKTDGRRVTNASAIWRVVASCAFAISASRRPPGV